MVEPVAAVDSAFAAPPQFPSAPPPPVLPSPKAIPLSLRPSAFRPAARPIPLPDQPGSPILSRGEHLRAAPPYAALCILTWVLRILAALGGAIALFSVVFQLAQGRLSAERIFWNFTDLLVVSVLLVSVGEALVALRDIAQNSFRR
jgi:hypothetical protein